MRLLRPSLIYFALVFGTGFLLGTLRVLLVLPPLGDRTAQLIEMPVMLVAVVFAARRTNRFLAGASGPWSRLAVGLIALALMLAAEIVVGVTLRGQSALGALINRDPVSGTAYYLALCAFALMP